MTYIRFRDHVMYRKGWYYESRTAGVSSKDMPVFVIIIIIIITIIIINIITNIITIFINIIIIIITSIIIIIIKLSYRYRFILSVCVIRELY